MPSGPRVSGLYGLIDSAGDRVTDHAPTGGHARGVFVNDALIDPRAFVLAGISCEPGVVRHVIVVERGIDLGPDLGLRGCHGMRLSVRGWTGASSSTERRSP